MEGKIQMDHSVEKMDCNADSQEAQNLRHVKLYLAHDWYYLKDQNQFHLNDHTLTV